MKPYVGIAAVMAVLVLMQAGCSKSDSLKTFDCRRFQLRASSCQPQILDLAKKRIQADKSHGVKDESDQQYRMFESRLQKKIGQENARKQCERYRDSASGDDKKRLALFAGCFAKDGCSAFAECILNF